MKSYNIKKVNPAVYNTNRIICFGSDSFLNLSLSYASQNAVQMARPDKNMDISNIMGSGICPDTGILCHKYICIRT